MTEQTVREIMISSARAAGWSGSGEWDSLVHISVLIALNSAYSGKIADVPKVQEAKDLDAMLSVLRAARLVA